MLELLGDPQAWLAFITLALLEIVLGIDNLIFIAILVALSSAAIQRAKYGRTVFTWVCCSINSLTTVR